jgi:hypothetical protein
MDTNLCLCGCGQRIKSYFFSCAESWRSLPESIRHRLTDVDYPDIEARRSAKRDAVSFFESRKATASE